MCAGWSGAVEVYVCGRRGRTQEEQLERELAAMADRCSEKQQGVKARA